MQIQALFSFHSKKFDIWSLYAFGIFTYSVLNNFKDRDFPISTSSLIFHTELIFAIAKSDFVLSLFLYWEKIRAMQHARNCRALKHPSVAEKHIDEHKSAWKIRALHF